MDMLDWRETFVAKLMRDLEEGESVGVGGADVKINQTDTFAGKKLDGCGAEMMGPDLDAELRW